MKGAPERPEQCTDKRDTCSPGQANVEPLARPITATHGMHAAPGPAKHWAQLLRDHLTGWERAN